ncbi:RNA polymerase sigma factor [Martelella endophytica]|uniref:RNA polymerase subunit sigma-24 n=1 Tax=Martelella endophytica TaxID=1486262 RepID=A0A0D5LSK7_MAREN|nr:RNA polymerase sigma factor [Martelella endophytica]AJY47071.1 hypothetical protein TM49_17575 [Martelella endophytica]
MSDDLRWMIERQIPHLRRYAFALTRNRDDADDLVQDTLERALRKWRLFGRKGRLRSWLFRILYRTYIDRVRAAKPETASAEPEIIDRLAVQLPDQEDRAECASIAGALDRLPAEQRVVILLVALDGMAYDEVAELLDVPVGTIRSRLSRGREALREARSRSPRTTLLRRVK